MKREPFDIKKVRNFAIIAHIDHGKSTLADRLLEFTGMIHKRDMRAQVLDSMDLERERGITIKAHTVTLDYHRPDGVYTLNLIDTPGHVDFTYEVSRSLAACEGALLVVDVSQGVEAQTVANLHLATDQKLKIIPVLNKIDLPHGQVEEILDDLEQSFGFPRGEAIRASAKEGIGTEEILEAVVTRIPPPKGTVGGPLQVLIFDAFYDEYRGVVIFVKLKQGRLGRGDSVRMLGTNAVYEVQEVGKLRPAMEPAEVLHAGEAGYFTAQVKALHDVKIGDTLAPADSGAIQALPGYKEPKPMVFCGMYPVDSHEFETLRTALQKLSLNDASFSFVPESSAALGFGFRCGFLGMLHMEIVQERLERQSGIELIQTAPNVNYRILTTAGELIDIDSPGKVPDAGCIQEFREPLVTTRIVIPQEYIGGVMKLLEDRRGHYVRTEYLSSKRVILIYDVPLAEIIFDFFDKLKSATRGYGTMDYDLADYFPADLVKLDILVGGQRVDALSAVMHRQKCDRRGRALLLKLKREIPKHLFVIALQAAIGGRIIARESISAVAKNVTSKCYGGDITRKRKLLEKQKEGKKRMKSIGLVSIPQEAFLSVLKIPDE